MAWNGRVVKTYGRHRRRMIKNEAWISPEIKSSAPTNVFSSPDTDISVTSANGSIDATTSSTNARSNKQSGKGCKLVGSPLARDAGSNKENKAVTLAPDTPEEEQGSRKRGGGVRNGRKVTKNKDRIEHTPKLFSSDSEDGLRKVVGRKALSMKNNVVETRGTTTKKHPSTTKASAPPRRVKNIIQNETYTIVRSPPPRCQRSSKRYKSSNKPWNKISTSDSNTSMSPFGLLESWIDVVAATSTPMVQLTKLDWTDKRFIIGDESLENSMANGDQENCVKHLTSGSCTCKTCQDTEKVAGKLFELTLSDDDDGEEVNVGGRRLRGKTEQNNLQGRGLRRRQKVNYKEDSLEDVKSRMGRQPKLSKARRETSQKVNKVEVSSCSHDFSLLDSSASSRGSSSDQMGSESGDSSGKGARLGHVSNNSECSVLLTPLSKKMQSLHLNVCDDDDDDREEERDSIRRRIPTRGSQDQKSDKERVLRTRGLSKGDKPEKDESTKTSSVLTRTRTQSQRMADAEESDEDESVAPKLRTRGQSRCQSKDKNNDEVKGPASRRLRSRKLSTEEEEGSDESEEIKPSGRRIHTRSECTGDDTEEKDETELTPRRMRRRGPSREQEEESDDVFTVRRIQSRGQSEEEEEEDDEPMYPVTPRKKHLASFHTDSFKEVFTPKKHKETGLPVTGRDKVLQQCEQTTAISFTECISPAMLNKCVKIGEGVYGEVFRTTIRRQSVALKIIPIEGDFEVNEEPQKTFDEILPEIVISRELSYLSEGEENYSSNYIGVNNVSCVKGRYPEALLTEWDKYDARKESENDRPDIFDEEQLYIVFEFADGGQDLESFEFDNLQQATSVLQQVAGALAVAEKQLEFEHRDLHWGNVLIRSTGCDHVLFRLGDDEYRVASHGLEVSIIDFTLSRLQKDDCTIFCDLAADPTLFDGTGDYQFQVYRKMKKENDNNWEPFEPYTNVLWLHYIADKLINTKTYQKSDTKAHKSALKSFRSFYRYLLRHSSAEQVVLDSDLLDL